MSRRTSDFEYRRSQWVIAAVYLLLVGFFGIATASAETGERTSSSKQFVTGGRDATSATVETRDAYAAIATDGARLSTRNRPVDALRSGGSSAAGSVAAAGSLDFWIHDADVIVFGDDDADGFYYGIDLLFDADTVWNSADVYAVLYLSLDGGPWNEYAVTEDFRIAGARADDEFVVITELESGYPTGDYDLLIELFDADNGDFLADYGPELNSALSLLPLEDFNRDAPTFDIPVTVTRSSGGGGATGLTGVLLLAGLVVLRLSRRRVFDRRSLSRCA